MAKKAETEIFFNRINFASELCDAVRYFLSKEEFCDLVLWSGDKKTKFKAHSIVIFAQIPFLKPENYPTDLSLPHEIMVPLNETNLRKIIDFCYTGRIQMIYDKEFIDIFSFASNYEIRDLSEVCLNAIGSKTTKVIKDCKQGSDILEKLEKGKDFEVQKEQNERLLVVDLFGLPYGFRMEMITSKADKWTSLSIPFSSEMAVEWKYNAFVLVDGEQVFVIGGWKWKITKQVDCLNLRTMELKSLACLRNPRADHSAVVLNGDVYVAGGWSKHAYRRSVERYDQSTKKWSFVKSMVQRRSHLQLITVSNVLYAIGGENSTGALSSVEYYDATFNFWSLTTPMNMVRIAPAAIVSDKYIYVMGGSESFHGDGNCTDTNTVERFDIENKTWTMIASLSCARHNIAACIFQNELFAIGGLDSKSKPQATVEVYHKFLDKWTRLEDLNEARGDAAAFIVSDYIDEHVNIPNLAQKKFKLA